MKSEKPKRKTGLFGGVKKPRAEAFYLKVPKEEEKLNGKNRYRSRKFIKKLQKLLDQDRTYSKFKCYKEDQIFPEEMKKLEIMFR